jgi:hypothetical protein
MERTGFPDGQEPKLPVCPVCGEECDEFYRDKDGDILGCENCIDIVDSYVLED